mmetsp:Transcript_13500/g.29905  ORF Transcript_13500/g.29905 Transcript_13500/m.29905 type:complete len:859 (+) Transcript_13500:44-2620(+)
MAAAAGATTDMSAKVGGRIITPHLPVVNSSGPNETELSFDELFTAFSDKHIPLEPTEGIQRRERVLDRMGSLAGEWVKSVCSRQGLDRDAVEAAGGQLFTSGSYRLGVHEPGADIDTILVAPNMCTREDFFGTNPEFMTDDGGRDPLSLAERIRAHPDVTNFVPVEGAAVPILTFDWEGVNIDLLFARINSATAPQGLDIDSDKILDGVDSATEKSLNGPRVTNLIAALAKAGSPDRYQVFLKVVRIVRKWAKARGLYSNKMGYWGGVNINIAVCLTLQLYPNACPASLLRRFFLVFKTWRWPSPVMLTKPHDAGLGLTVWSQHQGASQRQVAPIITPAYPAMNSTLAVSRQTLQIMHEEFCRGYDIIDRLWKDHQKGEKTGTSSSSGDGDKDPCEVFAELLEPSDFFINYPNYLSLCIAGPTLEDSQAWAGFVESRLRKLVSDQLARSLPISKIQLWPKKFEACVADRTALLTKAQRQNSITYFVGFLVDRLRMRGSELNVEQQIQNFRQWDLSRFQPMVPGMDLYVRSFTVKELPRICFEGMYEGGKVEAMKKRRRIRDADPRRQEAKRVRRLAKLKARMAAMQKKKEEAAAAAKAEAEEKVGEKRKRDGTDDDADEEARLLDEVEQIETKEGETSAGEGGGAEAEGEEEDEELLESALDQIQEDEAAGVGKTREEAENDRQKLLAGELLVEGGEDVVDEADDYAFLGDVRHANLLPQEGRAQGEDGENRNDEEAEILKRAGYAVISDDEVPTVGGNMILPWREPEAVSGVKKEEEGSNVPMQKKKPAVEIKFKTKFDIVELDADGYVVDKGDEDFKPSKKWIGRRGGFEFKLGERGLGYYRTGKKIVVPSNTAYN